MIDSERWLLPEGIEEVLPERAIPLERLRRKILDLFHSWGYKLVIPPFIEYLQSLLVGTGVDLDLQTFKLTDQLTGHLMGVRADMTPQVARIDAHYHYSDGPVRLCYLGTVLRTRPEGMTGTRSPLQVGAELYGHNGIESDVEILQLVVETLELTGIQNIHLDLGHVGIFRSLAKVAGINEEQENTLFDASQRKARPELEEILASWDLSSDFKEMFISLIELNGAEQVLEAARHKLKKGGQHVLSALDNLEAIAQLLLKRLPALHLYYDLAELRGYSYQTGMVFAAYSPDYGQEIARGGRYDDIGKAFGRARSATGFSTDLKTLVELGNRLEPDSATNIYAPYEDDHALYEQIKKLRASGECVVCGLPGIQDNMQELGCDRVLTKRGSEWVPIKIKGCRKN